MDKKHIAIAVFFITFAIIITVILVWMMTYQSDVVKSPTDNASQAPQVANLNENNTFFEGQWDFDSEEIPENSETISEEYLLAESKLTEPALITPAVLEQPKVYWSQFNKNLLELEQEQSAIMTLLLQKSAYFIESEALETSETKELIESKTAELKTKPTAEPTPPPPKQPKPMVEISEFYTLIVNRKPRTWLTVGKQLIELEQWREKTIHSLNSKLTQ